MLDDKLLYGSESLTAEEIELREKLVEWCQDQFDNGARPVPLYASLLIVADMVADAGKYFVRGKNPES